MVDRLVERRDHLVIVVEPAVALGELEEDLRLVLGRRRGLRLLVLECVGELGPRLRALQHARELAPRRLVARVRGDDLLPLAHALVATRLGVARLVHRAGEIGRQLLHDGSRCSGGRRCSGGFLGDRCGGGRLGGRLFLAAARLRWLLGGGLRGLLCLGLLRSLLCLGLLRGGIRGLLGGGVRGLLGGGLLGGLCRRGTLGGRCILDLDAGDRAGGHRHLVDADRLDELLDVRVLRLDRRRDREVALRLRDVVDLVERDVTGLDRDEQLVLTRLHAIDDRIGELEQLQPFAALALHALQERERRDDRLHRRCAVLRCSRECTAEERRTTIEILEPLHPLERELAEQCHALAVIRRALGAPHLVLLEIVPPALVAEQRLVHEVRRGLFEVLDEDALEELFESGILGGFDLHDTRSAQQHADALRIVEPIGVVG